MRSLTEIRLPTIEPEILASVFIDCSCNEDAAVSLLREVLPEDVLSAESAAAAIAGDAPDSYLDRTVSSMTDAAIKSAEAWPTPQLSRSSASSAAQPSRSLASIVSSPSQSIPRAAVVIGDRKVSSQLAVSPEQFSFLFVAEKTDTSIRDCGIHCRSADLALCSPIWSQICTLSVALTSRSSENVEPHWQLKLPELQLRILTNQQLLPRSSRI